VIDLIEIRRARKAAEDRLTDAIGAVISGFQDSTGLAVDGVSVSLQAHHTLARYSTTYVAGVKLDVRL
jgi:hypothetical protein